MSLNSTQRAFMRVWITRSIKRLRDQPETAARSQMIGVLEQSLERYADPPSPSLRLIKGGRYNDLAA